MSSINQKEYLKKYLGIGKALGEKKKKKRKEKTFGTRLKIVDDDIEASISQEIQDDLSGTNEDAPLVVAVIDERPPSLRIDDETKNNLWKPIGEPDNVIEDLNFKLGSSFQLNKLKSNFLNAQTEFKKPGNIQSLHTSQSRTRKKYDKTSHDMSPSRKRESVKIEKYNNDSSPPRQRRFEGDSSDQMVTEDHNDNKQYKDKDFSPPRRNIHPERSKRYEDNSSNQRDENIDIFPPRKNYSKKTEKKDVDTSPPQKYRNSTKPNNRNEDNYPRQKNRDDDISPPRKKNYINPEKVDSHSQARKNRERDLHQMRQNISYKNKDNSPPRQRDNYLDSLPNKKIDDTLSPPRQIIKRKNSSLSYKHSTSDQGQKKSRWGSPERSYDTPDKVKVTLSGKRAGLQNAKDITKEIISLREKEDNMFCTMSEEISGINAATVVRDRVPRDLEEEALQLKKQKETKEKYDKWGKGLKQVQDHNEKMAEQLYEMSKPLARYADDEDLDKYLKEQEREGDPMLAYIRKKKKKNAVEAGIPEKPTYMGEFMPNRFGIKPGYRWDGVDRSNGYEKKWFEVQNKKKANLEEAHKWSTEDM